MLQVSEWQPMELAPRDGSKIDVWTENGFRYIDVFWYAGPAYPEGAFVYFDSQLLLLCHKLTRRAIVGRSIMRRVCDESLCLRSGA